MYKDLVLFVGYQWVLYLTLTFVGFMILYGHEPFEKTLLKSFAMYIFKSTFIFTVVNFICLNVAIKRRFSLLDVLFK